MALIIENGTIVANANSYLTEVEAQTILLDTFGITATISEANLKAATQYLETFRGRYQGRKTSPADQSLQFPRIGLCIDNYPISSDEIPLELKNSQALGAYYESDGKSLLVVSNKQTITSKSIDGVGSFGYSDNGEDSKQLKFPLLDSELRTLFKRFGVHRV